MGPATTLEYLGVILDTANMETRLPQNKVDQIISFIGTFLSRRSIRKRELLQLLGHFNFAVRVISGRSFVLYLINLFTKVNNLNYYVSLSPECEEDIKMWHIFLKQWNRVSLSYDTLTTSSDNLVLFTDAVSTFGFGGYFQGKWFSSPWPSELSYLMDSEMSMAF